MENFPMHYENHSNYSIEMISTILWESFPYIIIKIFVVDCLDAKTHE